MHTTRPLSLVVLILVAFTLSACNTYVRRAEFDGTVQQLRATDQRQQAQLDSLQSRLDTLQADLTRRFEGYDARFTQFEGRLHIDMTAHFDFDDARVREQDRAALEQFASVIREHHPNVLVTVEGFTDPAGSPAYNQRLGLRRAENVRQHLVGSGIPEQQVRAVSYGEDRNRQVRPGAWGADGEPNRRVALVIDYVG
jgi:peptidoglycan-associated lipoprotein